MGEKRKAAEGVSVARDRTSAFSALVRREQGEGGEREVGTGVRTTRSAETKAVMFSASLNFWPPSLMVLMVSGRMLFTSLQSTTPSLIWAMELTEVLPSSEMKPKTAWRWRLRTAESSSGGGGQGAVRGTQGSRETDRP